MQHIRTIPVLRSFDEPKAREFYCGFLGFSVDFEHRFEPDLPLFMGLSLGEMRIYLSEHHGDASPGAHVVFEITGLRDYHAGLLAQRYRYARPGLGDYIGGGIHVCIGDPFGNTIEFVERDA
jgi:catechol 2,3-dioxygenase-like lactoylglutathione lyase family enzyme